MWHPGFAGSLATREPTPSMNFKKVFLIILDGFGLDLPGPGNAVTTAGMKYLNSLMAEYPSYPVVASGLIVGLPWGKYGNSEVGHSAIGAGRIIVQDWARINQDIVSGQFFKHPVFKAAVEHCRKNGSNLHLIGCVSPGGIHSHEDHLFALLRFAAMENFKEVFVHMITDGQDAGPREGIVSLAKLNNVIANTEGRIASVIGRIYAMDRLLNWKMTEQAWRTMVDGEGVAITDPEDYFRQNYAKDISDHEIESAVVMNTEDTIVRPVATIGDNDALIFFNYRNDRMKQLVSSFVSPDFKEFEKKKAPSNLFVVTMTRYADDFDVHVAYEPLETKNILGEVISKQGWQQYRIAEKEKEAHVTNFFNGGRISPFEGEERVIVFSRKMTGEDYFSNPEMSAYDIAREVVERMDEDKKLFVINFANSDIISHTGNIKATVKALDVLDDCIKQIVEKVITNPEYAVVIAADHGNSEEMIDPSTGAEDTQHSSHSIPLVFVAQQFRGTDGSGKSLELLAREKPIGTLLDIAPSVLDLLGVEKPKEMTGSTLVAVADN